MKTERPRTRLVILADILDITVRASHMSRGGQVTKEFFREVADAVGVPEAQSFSRNKIGLCDLICNYLAIPFEGTKMVSRGARITNAWFDAIIERFDNLNAILRKQHSLLKVTKLGRNRLAAHLRTERTETKNLDLGLEAACYCCGDCTGARLSIQILEAHCTLPYDKSSSKIPGVGDFVAVCPSCHKVLHLRGIQAKQFRREIRP